MKNTNIPKLLNNITKIPGDSLLEKIMSYCEEHDLDPQEIGDLLADNEQFKRVLWIDAVNNNQIKDVLLKEKINQTGDLDLW